MNSSDTPQLAAAGFFIEEFGNSGFIGQIYTDEGLGAIFDGAIYKGNDHREFVKGFVSSYGQTQEAVNKHFGLPFRVASFEKPEEERVIEPSNCIELARNPIVRLPLEAKVGYGFGNRADFFLEMQRAGIKGYDDKSVTSAIRILRDSVETPRTLEFVQDPATVFPSDRGYFKTPLHSLNRSGDENRELEPGIYVSITGIPNLAERLVEAVRGLNYKIYCAPAVAKELPNAIPQDPNIVTNPSIRGVFSRLGWGAVNLALMNKKPLITIHSGDTEDPEIILNERLLVNELEVASLMDARPFSEVLEDATGRVKNTEALIESAMAKYHTLEGPKYAAEIVARMLT